MGIKPQALASCFNDHKTWVNILVKRQFKVCQCPCIIHMFPHRNHHFTALWCLLEGIDQSVWSFLKLQLPSWWMNIWWLWRLVYHAWNLQPLILFIWILYFCLPYPGNLHWWSSPSGPAATRSQLVIYWGSSSLQVVSMGCLSESPLHYYDFP